MYSSMESEFELAAKAYRPANSNQPSPLLRLVIGAKERGALLSILMFKASVLHTTEQWVKECAELFLAIDDLYEMDVSDYESTVEYLMAFDG